MARCLVTGGSGLVGTNLTERLIKDGHVVLSHQGFGEFDLLDRKKIDDYVTSFKPDYVFHLAAQAAESRGQISPINMTKNNAELFLNVLVPCINLGIERFIYISSVSVYGDCEVPYSEDEIPKPKDIYGINKYVCEQMLKVLSKVHGIPFTIFRPHNIYGPHQDMRNPYKNVTALFMRWIMEEKKLTIYGEGKMMRSFSYVEDVVDVLVASLDPKFKNQTVNIGSSLEYQVIDLLRIIEKVSGKQAEIEFFPARPQEIWNFLANHRKLRLLHDYKETSLEEGIKKTWEWAKKKELPNIRREEDEIYTP